MQGIFMQKQQKNKKNDAVMLFRDQRGG